MPDLSPTSQLKSRQLLVGPGPLAAGLGVALLLSVSCSTVTQRHKPPPAVSGLTPREPRGPRDTRLVQQRVGEARRRIAQLAMEMVRTQSLGRYRLGSNDCTNFVARAVEKGAGISLPNHDFDKLENRELQYFTYFALPDGSATSTILPGDVLWLIPRRGISHVGVVGTDRRVYHFSKLRGQPQRYAAERLPVFLKHFKAGLKQCVVFRLERLPRSR
ncbi:MAG: hypothetical protein HY318_05185 [Armatimonadetes bacterium]|nr:hypothetical protein [Armatimonadota bacterium]